MADRFDKHQMNAREAIFYDRMDVSLELAKGYHMEEARDGN